jgi:hypothetical protein
MIARLLLNKSRQNRTFLYCGTIDLKEDALNREKESPRIVKMLEELGKLINE